MAAALRRGYATASTDTGHTGDDMVFGQGHPEKVIDYGWRAIHVMTDTAKLMVRNAQGRLADKSYFVGCSAGGHQAMSEVQRFPDDYDGVVAGAPAHNRIRQAFGFMWSWTATHTPDGKPILTQPKLALVTKAVVEACDGLDGLKDGLITDPRTCTFDPAKLACSGADDASCLTPPQVDAIRKVYDGARNPRTGEQIYTGWPRGSEGFGEPASQSWRQYLLEPGEPSRIGLFRYFLFHDPNWDVHTLDYDRDLAYAEERLPHLPAVSRDLSAFKRRGSKLLMYGGWMDPVVPPQDTAAVLRGGGQGDGRLRQDARFLPPLHGAGHGPLRRRPRSKPVRRADGARAVGREGRGARDAARFAQQQRKGRPHTSPLCLPAGGALQGCGQHRRCVQLRLRRPGAGGAASTHVELTAVLSQRHAWQRLLLTRRYAM